MRDVLIVMAEWADVIPIWSFVVAYVATAIFRATGGAVCGSAPWWLGAC